MNGQRENKSVDVKRDKLRRKVREMEAFGWVLDETEDLPGKWVRMKFWRPTDLPDINKLRKLEYDLSRLPGENSAFNLKFIAGLLVCVLLGTGAATSANEPLISLVIGIVVFEVLLLILVAVMNPEYKRLSRRRDRILHRARMFIEAANARGGAMMKREGMDEDKIETG